MFGIFVQTAFGNISISLLSYLRSIANVHIASPVAPNISSSDNPELKSSSAEDPLDSRSRPKLSDIVQSLQ